MTFGDSWFESDCPFIEGRTINKNGIVLPIKFLIDTGSNMSVFPDTFMIDEMGYDEDEKEIEDWFTPQTGGKNVIRFRYEDISFEFLKWCRKKSQVHKYTGYVVGGRAERFILGMDGMDDAKIDAIVMSRKRDKVQLHEL